jgi:hypothetical protein
MELERDPETITAMTDPDLIRWRTDAAAEMQSNPADTGLVALYRLSTEERGNRLRNADRAQPGTAQPQRPKPKRVQKQHRFAELRGWGAWS